MTKHPISSYNKYICLKVNGLMIAISIYLLKPYIIEIASIANRKDRSELVNLFYADKLQLSLEAAAAIPFLFLVYAWTRRTPGASETVQKIWSKGKSLILTVAFLQLCVISSPLWLQLDTSMSKLSWIQSFIYILVIAVTYYSTYMRDCFADFPESDKKENERKSL